MYVSRDKRRIDFRGLTGSQRTPRDWGVTSRVLKMFLKHKEKNEVKEPSECTFSLK